MQGKGKGKKRRIVLIIWNWGIAKTAPKVSDMVVWGRNSADMNNASGQEDMNTHVRKQKKKKVRKSLRAPHVAQK